MAEVDPHCPEQACAVYVDGARAYSVLLQLKEGVHDKFIVLQLLASTRAAGAFFVLQRWGRTGAVGQTALTGPLSLEAARAAFAAKFKSKTKNTFGAAGGFVHQQGMYDLVDVVAAAAASKGSGTGKESAGAAGKASKVAATASKAAATTSTGSAAAKAAKGPAGKVAPTAKAAQGPPGKAVPRRPAPTGSVPRRPAPTGLARRRRVPDSHDAAEVVVAWRRYMAAFEGHGGTPQALGGPAADADIAKLEAAFGQPLTVELGAFLKVVDGAILGVGSYNELFSCTQMIDQLEQMRTLWENEWKDNPALNGAAAGADRQYTGVRFAWWRMGWLPIGGDGTGNVFVMDYDPDPATGGVVGQLLDHDHETGDCPCIASTLAAYLNQHAEAIETGEVEWDDDMVAFVELGDGGRGGGGDGGDDDDDDDDDDFEEEDDATGRQFTVLGRGQAAPIDINMRSAEVFALMGKTETKRTRRSKDYSTGFGSCRVRFDKDGHVACVSVRAPSQLAVQGRNVLAMPYYAACDYLKELDPELQVCDYFPVSFALNVCFFCFPDLDNPFEPVLLAAYFRDGYFDNYVDRRPYPGVAPDLLALAAWAHETAGLGVPVDIGTAVDLYQRAAACGSALAMARCAENGWAGMAVDPQRAYQQYTLAGKPGGKVARVVPIAQHALVACLERGFGVPVSATKARQLRAKSAAAYDALLAAAKTWRTPAAAAAAAARA